MEEGVGNYKEWKRYVKRKISLQETKKWKNDILKSKSAKLLRNKIKPKWESYLIGNESARALFKLRAGDWDMWDKRKKWDKEGNKKCRICGAEVEDVQHLTTECDIKGKPEIFRRNKYKGKKGMNKILGLGMVLGEKEWAVRRVFL